VEIPYTSSLVSGLAASLHEMLRWTESSEATLKQVEPRKSRNCDQPRMNRPSQRDACKDDCTSDPSHSSFAYCWHYCTITTCVSLYLNLFLLVIQSVQASAAGNHRGVVYYAEFRNENLADHSSSKADAHRLQPLVADIGSGETTDHACSYPPVSIGAPMRFPHSVHEPS